MVLSCASPLTPPLTRSPSTNRDGAGCDRRHPTGQDGERLWPRPAVARAGSDDHVKVKQLGRRRGKKTSGYHRQSRMENTFFRDTSIIGDGLRARSPAGQGSEVVLGCEILNRMTELGRPVSYRIGR